MHRFWTDQRESQPVASLANVLRLDEDSAQNIPDIKTLEGSGEPMDAATDKGFIDCTNIITTSDTFKESDKTQTVAKGTHKRRRTGDDDTRDGGQLIALSSESSDFDFLSVSIWTLIVLYLFVNFPNVLHVLSFYSFIHEQCFSLQPPYVLKTLNSSSPNRGRKTPFTSRNAWFNKSKQPVEQEKHLPSLFRFIYTIVSDYLIFSKANMQKVVIRKQCTGIFPCFWSYVTSMFGIIMGR